MKDVIESLKVYERSDIKERAPLFRKWRALKIQGFRKVSEDFLSIIPHPESGVTEKEFNQQIKISEVEGKIPTSILFDGGWILFNGRFIGSFLSNQEFESKHREVASETAIISYEVNRYQITAIEKNVYKDEERYLVHTGENTWVFIPDVFRSLNPEVGDWLLFDTSRKYSILRNMELNKEQTNSVIKELEKQLEATENA